MGEACRPAAGMWGYASQEQSRTARWSGGGQVCQVEGWGRAGLPGGVGRQSRTGQVEWGSRGHSHALQLVGVGGSCSAWEGRAGLEQDPWVHLAAPHTGKASRTLQTPKTRMTVSFA